MKYLLRKLSIYGLFGQRNYSSPYSVSNYSSLKYQESIPAWDLFNGTGSGGLGGGICFATAVKRWSSLNLAINPRYSGPRHLRYRRVRGLYTSDMHPSRRESITSISIGIYRIYLNPASQKFRFWGRIRGLWGVIVAACTQGRHTFNAEVRREMRYSADRHLCFIQYITSTDRDLLLHHRKLMTTSPAGRRCHLISVEYI